MPSPPPGIASPAVPFEAPPAPPFPGAEPAQDGDEESFLIDRQEIQAGAGVDDRRVNHGVWGPTVLSRRSSAELRSSSKAARSISTAGRSPGSAQATS